jgi:D-glycero-D-manno-heptose 1,7-bisphosphate phosphatase
MRRCVFFDRDGVINVKGARGDYIRNWRDLQIISTAVDWIRLFNALDLLVIVITNQRGVALGVMNAADLHEIHRHMREELALRGARIDDIYYCTHEEGVCECRKPRPGMIFSAARKWGIDIAGSIMIGDSETDRQLAEACGMRFVAVDDGRVLEVTT